MYVCFAYIYDCISHAPGGPEEGVEFPGIGVSEGCTCWEPNPSPLKEQPMLLTVKAPLQPQRVFICLFVCFDFPFS